MTLAEWYAQEDQVLLFRRSLNTEVMQSAVAVLQEHGLPIMRPVPHGTDPIQHGALINARREGYFECLRNFQALAVTPLKPEAHELTPWKKPTT